MGSSQLNDGVVPTESADTEDLTLSLPAEIQPSTGISTQDIAANDLSVANVRTGVIGSAEVADNVVFENTSTGNLSEQCTTSSAVRTGQIEATKELPPKEDP